MIFYYYFHLVSLNVFDDVDWMHLSKEQQNLPVVMEVGYGRY